MPAWLIPVLASAVVRHPEPVDDHLRNPEVRALQRYYNDALKQVRTPTRARACLDGEEGVVRDGLGRMSGRGQGFSAHAHAFRLWNAGWRGQCWAR
jgi:hypothetical protein